MRQVYVPIQDQLLVTKFPRAPFKALSQTSDHSPQTFRRPQSSCWLGVSREPYQNPPQHHWPGSLSCTRYSHTITTLVFPAHGHACYNIPALLHVVTCRVLHVTGAIAWQVKGLQYSTGQVQKLGLQEAFQQVVRQEGVRALWKGNGVTMLHRLPYSAVNFWAYEQFTQQWHLRFPSAANHSQDAVLRRLLAGGAAGMCACTLVSLKTTDCNCMYSA